MIFWICRVIYFKEDNTKKGMSKNMKKRVLMLLLVTAALSVSCAGNEASKGNETDQTATVETTGEVEVSEDLQEEFTNGIVEEVVVPAPSLANNIIDEDLEKEIKIYLPADYEVSGLEYPVLYFLPGFGDSYADYMNIFKNALNSAKVKDMIVVTVNGKNKFHGSFYSNSPVIGNWEDYISQDLVSYIDENYRTVQDAAHRAIVGHSMGGTGAVSLGMNTSVFGHVYAMSPGLLAPDSFQETSVALDMIERKMEEYKEMSEEEAREDYLASVMSWPQDFTFGYASAFAYDAEGKAPFVLLPEKDADGNYVRDEIWERYESGFGKLSEKLLEKKENLSALSSLVIEYGDSDEFTWIPAGCEYFSKLLTEQGIDHKLEPYEGGHQEKVFSRITDIVIPHFQTIWSNNE